ncbi:CAMK protein kinase [Cladophialophora psammophila CBS 110553]|uniref:non-specific serine/threonine protein kinase n=1 Tax=Cladophialophora psammophila CBS 110553 TaxID=1182543 RepID=W9WHK3_9EURO|nr:CAMK protein kinase [Cladophialophora psammophila CBS 110553]EXJ67368.1 CAMK protein kinase [Cladophialophora psammophila CBS 110553]
MVSQPTQPATQPVDDPRRIRRNISNVSDEDAIDVICLLSPTSPAAFEAVKANLLVAPRHILQNDDLEDISQDDLLCGAEYDQPRDIALRMSSAVKNPKDGFQFGRTRSKCDVLLTPYDNDTLVSKVHFKIFVNNQGSLMLEDLSTNGTVVDDVHLNAKARRGNPALKPATIVLRHGAIISLYSGARQQEIKMMVRIPSRGDFEDAYEENLRKYLAARGDVAQFASMRESTYGNYWNGGSLYNFTGLLGKGAFATVYKVQTKEDGDIYAAKELDKRRFIKNGVLDMKFDSELNIMKNLNHPNIVNYVDCHTYQHWIYILMEYVPYGELAKELGKYGAIPEADVQQIAKQILHALYYLHRRNITHRDIKPDNILIASRNPLVVKLSDFGLSKCVTDQETFLKTFCGTLLYCAPEVYPDYANYAQGSASKRRRLGEPATKSPPSPYDQSVDMWSFGAVIFHLLCGKPPVTGRGDDRGAQMLNNIMTKNVNFDMLRQAKVSENAIDFVAKLLNRNPVLRPKEPECLQHPWLRDLPDHCNYEDVEEPVPDPQHHLDIVDEVDEDLLDDELIDSLNQLTQPPSSEHTPHRPVKRARTAMNVSPTEGDITYPHLPAPGESFLPLPPVPGLPAQRLFGEISASVLRSSGVFGGELSPTTPMGVHDIRNRVEQISVNDFGDRGPASNAENAEISGRPLQYPQVLDVPQTQGSSAASLMGAEQQIGQLNMASPEADISDAATPETTNPVTPETRQLSPSASVTPHADTEIAETAQVTEEPVCTRRIDLGLIENPVDFEAEVEARNASRASRLRAKAETFHGNSTARTSPPSVELAVTIDAKTGREVGSMGQLNRFIRPAPGPETTIKMGSQTMQFVKPPRRYGKLTSLPGSFANVAVNLEDRFTVWGRGIDCTIQYPDTKDTRIPKYALKITFWAPGIEAHVDGGKDWTAFPGIRTLIATSASGSISVNDVELRKESPSGDAALFGKLHTDDIITIFDNGKGEFLKFKVEITFGESARPRPAGERGFVVQEERHHHQRMKQRESMRLSMRENADEVPLVPTVRVEPDC